MLSEQQIKRVLSAIGVGSSVIIVGLIAVSGFVIYKNILETTKLKLEIDKLKKSI